MKKRIFALLLSILLLCSTGIPYVNAENAKDFTVKVSDTTATAGDDRVAVDILLEDNPGIAGFSFCVNYDTDKLVLVESKINIEGGYKVVAQPTGYGVNLAWTGPSGYSQNGKIATLYFNVPKDIPEGETNIDIVYRTGYDSFYDTHEQDIAVNTVNGKMSITTLQETDKPSVQIGGVSVNLDATDIVVPIVVENNPGFSGFSFCINYDTRRLALESANVLMEGGYEVISHPEGYAVNIAWTSIDGYTRDGTIAELHFSVKDNAASGKGFISIAYRKGYDSFYSFVDGSEQDIEFVSYSGYVDISDHVYGEWVIQTPATCTSMGIMTRTCQDCAKTVTAVIPKADHDYYAVVTPPTCTTEGYTTRTCKNCSTSIIDTYVNVIDHTAGDWEQSLAPGCEVQGEESQICTVCGEVVRSRPILALGHSYRSAVTLPTCTKQGYTTYVCTSCNDSYISDYTNTLDHNYINGICDTCGDLKVLSSGSCGYDVKYVLYETGQLVITGTGTMYNYNSNSVPWYNFGTSISSVVINDGVTSIGNYAFESCSNLQSINIPDSIISIGDVAFSGCTSLTGIWVSEDNAVYCNDTFGVLFNKEKTQLIQVPSGIDGSYTIPDSVIIIGNYAFGDCSSLISVTIPSSVTDISDYAFHLCSRLTDVYYCGTAAQWSSIQIDEYNAPLLNAILHYHNYGDPVVITKPTFTTAGQEQKTCSLCGDTVIAPLDMLVGRVHQWNIVLEDDYAVNFYLQVSESIQNTAKVRFTVGNDTVTYNVSDLEKTEDGYFKLTANISAAQMNEFITVMVMSGRDIGSNSTYTARQYCDTILADNAYSQYHPLVKEMLNYGAMAQIYFDYDTGYLANEGITGTATTEIPEIVDDLTVNNKISDLSFYGASLVYRDRIAVRYYFTGDVTGCTFTANGNTYIPVEKDGMHYVEIADILPQNIAQQIILNVTDASGNDLTVTYGPMNYIVRMNAKGSDTLKALVKALYNYHLAAKALSA